MGRDHLGKCLGGKENQLKPNARCKGGNKPGINPADPLGPAKANQNTSQRQATQKRVDDE